MDKPFPSILSTLLSILFNLASCSDVKPVPPVEVLESILLILAITLASPVGSPLLSPSVSFTLRMAAFKFCSSVFLMLLTSLVKPLFSSPIAVVLASI